MLIHRTSIVPVSICVGLLAGACASKVASNAAQGTGGATTCGYNGKAYAVGTSFAVDSCNICACSSSAQLVCTQRDCTSPAGGAGGAGSGVVCLYNQQSYAPGASVPAPDSCNSCYCSAGGQVVCSSNLCVSPATGGTPGFTVFTGGTFGSGNASGTGGAVGAGGSFPVGGTKAITSTAATGGTGSLLPLPKACPGLPFASSVPDAGTACVGAGTILEPPPLDIYLMLDRTQSMTNVIQNTSITRWDVIQAGMQQFLADPAVQAAAPRVGLAFFGATGSPNDPRECDPFSYATPAIEIEPVATSASKIQQAVINERQLLGGQTPWFPALEGALMHAQQWQGTNPLRTAIAVLITDGYPTECDMDVSHIQEMVGEFYAGISGAYNTRGAPGIRTYIVGVSVDKFNLDAVAQMGGTGQAFIVDGTNAVGQFASALVNVVTKAAVAPPCTIPLPQPPNPVDPAKVQLLYEPPAGVIQELPLVDSAANCGAPNGGFYYDNPAAPRSVTLCPCSCANVGLGNLEFRFGCTSFGIQ